MRILAKSQPFFVLLLLTSSSPMHADIDVNRSWHIKFNGDLPNPCDLKEGRVEDSSNLNVYREVHGYTLREDLKVDLLAPSGDTTARVSADMQPGSTEYKIPSGRKVDSWLVHFDPREESPSTTPQLCNACPITHVNRTAMITFTRPIIGVIYDDCTLVKADCTLNLNVACFEGAIGSNPCAQPCDHEGGHEFPEHPCSAHGKEAPTSRGLEIGYECPSPSFCGDFITKIGIGGQFTFFIDVSTGGLVDECRIITEADPPLDAPFDPCILRPLICGEVEIEDGDIILDCAFQDCVRIDPIPKNCEKKWDCPGCVPGMLCPPFFHIYLSGLTRDWDVSLANALGETADFSRFEAAEEIVLSFRPEERFYIDRKIGEYMLVFKLKTGAKSGTRVAVKSKVMMSDKPYSGPK